MEGRSCLHRDSPPSDTTACFSLRYPLFCAALSQALFRRGSAYIVADNYYKAQQDLKHALEIDPKNLAVRKKMAELNSLMAQQDAKERSLYSSMFT